MFDVLFRPTEDKELPFSLKMVNRVVSSVRGTGNAIFVQNTMGKASYCKYQHVVNINILHSAILLVEVNTDS